ncbi:hypothetical protein PsYK624_110660 [Phanerochaete sordida]|uniref:Uncharacterized protein n=1 Tax=Phanerochaete sordida TaxID=48140 RepID=A0A9P3GJU4_9APHY|nr:hypothetical protein PsYK624_110660 [Phanerochaete sordida]
MACSSNPMPLLPLRISSSPLLSGTLADDFMATLVARGVCNPLPSLSFAPTRRYLAVPKSGLSVKSNSNKPLPLLPKPSIPPKQIIALLDLLEQMDNDVVKEIERVRQHIKEVRATTEAFREEREVRYEQIALRKDQEERETKRPDDEFWLNA